MSYLPSHKPALSSRAGVATTGWEERDKALNAYGEEGWELVGFQGNLSVFKRPCSSSQCADCGEDIYSHDYLCDRCRELLNHA